MAYYRITIELKEKTVTGVREYERGLDMAFTTFKYAAEQFYGSKMLHFDCVQLADRSEEVQTLIKQKGKTGKTTYELEPGTNLGIDPINESTLNLHNLVSSRKTKPPTVQEQQREAKKLANTLGERMRLENLKKDEGNKKKS